MFSINLSSVHCPSVLSAWIFIHWSSVCELVVHLFTRAPSMNHMSSFSTFAHSDAQNIVSELLSSPKAYHVAPASQLHPDAS
jgi:hypothetical protein